MLHGYVLPYQLQYIYQSPFPLGVVCRKHLCYVRNLFKTSFLQGLENKYLGTQEMYSMLLDESMDIGIYLGMCNQNKFIIKTQGENKYLKEFQDLYQNIGINNKFLKTVFILLKTNGIQIKWIKYFNLIGLMRNFLSQINERISEDINFYVFFSIYFNIIRFIFLLQKPYDGEADESPVYGQILDLLIKYHIQGNDLLRYLFLLHWPHIPNNWMSFFIILYVTGINSELSLNYISTMIKIKQDAIVPLLSRPDPLALYKFMKYETFMNTGKFTLEEMNVFCKDFVAKHELLYAYDQIIRKEHNPQSSEKIFNMEVVNTDKLQKKYVLWNWKNTIESMRKLESDLEEKRFWVGLSECFANQEALTDTQLHRITAKIILQDDTDDETIFGFAVESFTDYHLQCLNQLHIVEKWSDPEGLIRLKCPQCLILSNNEQFR
jgi:hypothetical protein